MKIIKNREDYGQLEQEICGLHLVRDRDPDIDQEFSQLQGLFTETFSELENGDDYEFTEWHNNIRMLWVYLYSDQFYNSKLLRQIKDVVNAADRPWFAQFECYSPAVESSKNPNGVIGEFLIYQDSAIFSSNSVWDQVVPRIAG